jgi:hypothetical protein
MNVLLSFTALIVGAVLFLQGSTRIFVHDDGSTSVMVRCASGFVLVVAAVVFGVGGIAL